MLHLQFHLCFIVEPAPPYFPEGVNFSQLEDRIMASTLLGKNLGRRVDVSCVTHRYSLCWDIGEGSIHILEELWDAYALIALEYVMCHYWNVLSHLNGIMASWSDRGWASRCNCQRRTVTLMGRRARVTVRILWPQCCYHWWWLNH